MGPNLCLDRSQSLRHFLKTLRRFPTVVKSNHNDIDKYLSIVVALTFSFLGVQIVSCFPSLNQRLYNVKTTPDTFAQLKHVHIETS